jgi:hypothetical protein
MNYTRVNTKKLQAALAEAQDHLDKAQAILEPYLAILTGNDRQLLPRPPTTFPEAGRSLARAVSTRPEIAAATEYDGEAVCEDLDNAAMLAPIDEKLTELAQRVVDTRLQWLAEAWVPSLATYAVAKVRAKTDGALRTVVDPMAAVFATRRGRPTKAEAAAKAAADATPAAPPAKPEGR